MMQRWDDWAAEASTALGGDPVTHDAITAGYRILQRRRGHRYSLDDLATAAEAVTAAPEAKRHLDLGCGIGSVLLMVSWRVGEAQGLGIEALALSAELARRSIAGNGLHERLRVMIGDHRELTHSLELPPFDLVTGTPPYLPEGTALASPDPQRAAARIELRGGVEDYLASAARLLADDGRVVVCADGRKPERVQHGAAEVGLAIIKRLDVWPHATAPAPLLSVYTLARNWDAAPEHERMLVRNQDGSHTAEARRLRAMFGLARF